jgi:Uma2 family endonuclease
MEPPVERLETRRFTREQFRRMIDAGIFDADEHVELLHGRLVVVPPQGPPHSYVSTVLRDRLMVAFAGKLIREAKPLDCGSEQVPEPDLTVVRGSARDFEDRDPRADEALLVVEVSRTTQRIDRDKASIYAEGGAPVYWIVDLIARRVEVHTGPAGDRYRLVQVIGEDEELEVPGSDLRWLVRELLPSR